MSDTRWGGSPDDLRRWTHPNGIHRGPPYNYNTLPARRINPMPFPPKPFGKPFPPTPFKPKPVKKKPSEVRDYVTEAELWCRSISPGLLDSHIVKLRKQLEIAEKIRTERQAAALRFRQMPLAELEQFVKAGVQGWELGVAQQVLNERKPNSAAKKTMPPKPPRRPVPPRPAGPGGSSWRGKRN